MIARILSDFRKITHVMLANALDSSPEASREHYRRGRNSLINVRLDAS